MARQLTPPQLRRALRGDLESILARALAKAPEARYPSAGAFGEEVRRHLRGDPVLARRQTLLYRGGKFVRRHALPVTAALLIAGALATASLVAILSARRAARERDLAVAGERRAQAAMDVLVDLFALTDPAAGPAGDQVSIQELLARAEQRAAAINDPRLASRFFYDLGRIQRERTHFPDAARLLQRARQTAQASGDAPLREEIDLQLGITWRELLEPAEALRLLSDVVARRRDRLGPDAPATLDAERELALAHPAAAAVPRLESVLARQRRVLAADSDAPALTLHGLCNARWESGDRDGAPHACQAALDLLRRNGRESTPLGLAVLNDIAVMLEDPRRQEEVHRRGLAAAEAVYGTESVVVALTLNNLATALAVQGRLPEAEATFRQALALYQKRYGADHPAIANTLRNVGRMRQLRGHPEEALPLLRQAATLSSTAPRRERGTAAIAMQTARVGWVVERTPASFAALRAAVDAMQALAIRPDEPYRLDALLLLGLTTTEAGLPCEAVPLLREALELRGGLAATTAPSRATETRCALLDAERQCSSAGAATFAAELAWCRRELPRWGLADPELLARLRR
jgi:serine/threonine-protein kinase